MFGHGSGLLENFKVVSDVSPVVSSTFRGTSAAFLAQLIGCIFFISYPARIKFCMQIRRELGCVLAPSMCVCLT